MTCIAGIEQKGVVYIGGDSAGTASNFTQRVRKDKKVFIKDNFLIGFCGSFRIGQLLRHTLKVPKQPTGMNDVDYLVNNYVAAVKACFAADNKKWEEAFEGSFMVGYNGHLYVVHGDYQVAQPEIGFDAVGSGEDMAIGALHASKNIKNAEKRIFMALEASSINNAAVRPPFTIMKLGKK